MAASGLIVSRVMPGGIADQLGIAPGDCIRAVNDRPVQDVLDYRFHLADQAVELLVESGEGTFLYEIEKDFDQPLGLDFESPFPGLKKCGNRCLFCFVDQMPPGMRRSLYIRDDDYRLSFWDGNFITLTNLGPAEMERIVTQRLSPLYVSVHTTNPALRREMMGNRRAGEILKQMRFLTRHGIELHTQIVLCPGLNDGPELERTLDDLGQMAPVVRSVAVVPVGRTRFRDGLHPLGGFTAAGAAAVIDIIHNRQDRFLAAGGTPLVYAGDEFYIRAGRTVPPASRYDGFPQLENGVGLTRVFLDEWETVRREWSRLPAHRATVVTGDMGAVILAPLLEQLNRETGSRAGLVRVRNQFFGADVTAAGLLTGGDILATLRQRGPGDLVVVPAAALKDRTLFLDNVSLGGLGRDLGVLVTAAAGPRELIAAIENH